MAKKITSATILQQRIADGSAWPAGTYVICTVRMPIAEYEAFRVLAGLTDQVNAAETAFIAARLAIGEDSGQ